jgi:Ca-activated chloride channel family protein
MKKRIKRSLRKLQILGIFSLLIFSWQELTGAESFSVCRKNNKGINAYYEGRHEEAIEIFSDLLAEGNQAAEIYYNLAGVYYKEKEYDKTKDLLEQAIKGLKKEDQAKAYYNLGNVFFNHGELNKAVDNFQEGLKIDPDDEEAKYNLELALVKLKEKQPSQNRQEQQKEDKQDKKSEQQKEQKKQKQNQDQQTKQKEELQKQEERAQKENINRVLNLLQQKEKEARLKHIRKKNKQKQIMGKDW